MQDYKTKKSGTNWSNVYRISAFAFVDAFQFSFFVWSFWPFVQQLDPAISPSFIGLIMAVSGVGEALSAPLLGYWSNRIGKVIPPLIASLCLSIVANCSYMCLNGMPLRIRSIALLISRFLSGAGSDQCHWLISQRNRGITLAYVASCSTTYDRTRAMALCGGGALIGLTAGPAIQMGFTWIGSKGFDVLGFGLLRISMYTAPALLALLINFGCILFVLTSLPDNLDECDEDTISRKPVDNIDSTTIHETLTIYNNDDSIHRNSELGLQLSSSRQRNLSSACMSSASDDDDTEDNKSIASGASFSSIASRSSRGMDLVAVLVCMTTRSARMLVTSNVESVGAPYSQIMFNFDEKEVLTYNSMVQAALGVFTVGMLIVYAGTSYTRRVSERTNCIGAMLALLFFHLLTFSWFFCQERWIV
uniref:Uncharacterized protein n=1 Tax=Ditylenchus dipsaci TaxID=166011 RepID=A0A915CP52_9BILA